MNLSSFLPGGPRLLESEHSDSRGFGRDRFVQCLMLTLIALAFVAPRLFQVGTNIVTETYQEGSLRLLAGDDPYRLPLERGDRYEYSPLFALAYSPLALMSPKAQALVWAALNCFFFWLGVCAWFRVEKRGSRWLLLALLVCAMELNISVLYQQINALLIGLTLIALSLFRKERYFWAGVVIAIATNIKLLPGVFAFVLLFPWRPKYVAGLVVGALFAVLLPAVFFGFSRDFFLHSSWLHRLQETATMTRPPQLDIAGLLKEYGFSKLGWVLQTVVLVGSIGALIASVMRGRVAWYPWIAVGVSCLLLVSPRSESPTYVLIAPAYLFLTAFLVSQEKSLGVRAIGFLILSLSGFLITIAFTDLWAKAWWDPRKLHYATKTWGTALVWLLSMILLLRQIRFSPPRSLILDAPL